jgi:hypothetical protein
MSPAEFGKLTADETEKWAKVIRADQHQAGVIRESLAKYSVTSVQRNCGRSGLRREICCSA